MDQVWLTRELAAEGWGGGEVRRRARSGELQVIRRGAYADASATAVDPERRHLMLIAATVRQMTAPAVVSHQSAAVLHGLPTSEDRLTRVHLTRWQAGAGRVRRYVHLHSAPLPADDVCQLRGYRVTSLARTTFDLLRTLPPDASVPIGDAALRAGLDPELLASVAARCRGWQGVAAGRRAAALLDPRSESVGESRSRLLIHRLGLPPPEPQFEVYAAGRLVGRADFGWGQFRTLGEFDGRVKYGRLLKPGQTPGDTVFAEKRREDALRDLGWEVARWTWDDLRHPERVRERLERAFARGQRALEAPVSTNHST